MSDLPATDELPQCPGEMPLPDDPDAHARQLRRPRRLRAKPRFLTVEIILAWADHRHARTGRWPTSKSGAVISTLGESWGAIDFALTHGARGLPGGISLVRLLVEQRGVVSKAHLADLTAGTILAWVDAFHEEHGRWPHREDGPVVGSLGYTWHKVDRALLEGRRGLPGGSSLALLLAERRGHRHIRRLPPLTEDLILGWADAHFAAHGTWPTHKSGPVEGVPGEVWSALNTALADGLRTLPGGNSLVQLLADRRGRRNKGDLPPLGVGRILTWADAFHREHGRWPRAHDGPIPHSAGEDWHGVDSALVIGYRGFGGGSSLAKLLAEHRGVRNPKALPPLAEGQILGWARAYRRRHGRWPGQASGPVEEAPGETWAGVNTALQRGGRGLPGGSSLAKLLARRAGVRNSHDCRR